MYIYTYKYICAIVAVCDTSMCGIHICMHVHVYVRFIHVSMHACMYAFGVWRRCVYVSTCVMWVREFMHGDMHVCMHLRT